MSTGRPLDPDEVPPTVIHGIAAVVARSPEVKQIPPVPRLGLLPSFCRQDPFAPRSRNPPGWGPEVC